jgi:hypothetical protein
MAEEGPAPLLPWHQEVRILLEESKKCALRSPESFVKALQSLHRTLIHPTMHSLLPERDASLNRQQIPDGKPKEIQPPTLLAFSDSSAQQNFLRDVAEELIGLERIIFSVDDEVNGAHSSYCFDYEDDCGWYNDTLDESIRYTEVERSSRRDSERIGTTSAAFDCTGSGLICNYSERCIDKCLDACGYTLSLDAAVDCLHRIVHDSSLAASKSATYCVNNELQHQKKSKGHGFAAAITSLRTVRRRLLLLPASRSDERFNINSFPKPYQDAISRLEVVLGDQRMCNFQCMILPLEYNHNQRTYQDSKTHHDPAPPEAQQTRLLSDSLCSLARSVLPTLVSAACHTVDLPLPSWATPKISYGLLFHCAWKILLAGELIGKCNTTPSAQKFVDHPRGTSFVTGNTDNSNETTHLITNHSPSISAVASNHFQSLVRQMIEIGRTDIIAHQLYKCWKSFSIDSSHTHPRDLATPQSILYRQLESIIGSVPSKRNVATFFRAIILDCAKQEIPRSELKGYMRQQAGDRLDGVCKADMLPFLREVLLPSLAKDAALVDAIVQFIILSPPTSYRSESGPSQSYPTLHAIDRAVPRCLAQLLALTRGIEPQVNEAKSFQDVSDSDESDADSHHSFMEVHGFLLNLYAAANVWCEDVFITRTDTRQQQYVTEFLLQPLESKQLTKDDLQKSLSDDGTTVAAVLVQGVSLRLDVSRSESIRIDGMLVAEAMASILGQTLRFDELHPSCEDDAGITVKEVTETETKKTEKRRNRKKRVLEPKAYVLVDPDALVSNESDSSLSSSRRDSSTSSGDSSDESADSISSWGEDSLQPYAMDDDEEDLSRVPRPRSLRDCLAYLIASDSDALAYDKHHAALTELAPIIAAQPLDLHDVISTLVRVLLFLEDKFSMDQFAVKRWDSLIALGVNAPTEMCLLLVGEMRGNISLCTRLEVLSILKGISQALSGIGRNSQKQHMNGSYQEISYCSTKLLRALNLNDASNGGEDATKELSVQYTKTRRWRKHRTPTTSEPNRFGAVSVQMIYSLFSFLSQTRTDESVWGGSVGEKFLSEYLKTLAIMLYCASTYPSSSLLVFAADLFDLAWSFHSAECSEVRHAGLLAMLMSVSLLPLESVIQRAHGVGSFLKQCSELDGSSDCRHVASLILSRVSEVMKKNLIGS